MPPKHIIPGCRALLEKLNNLIDIINISSELYNTNQGNAHSLN
jgi:hypothetical protein